MYCYPENWTVSEIGECLIPIRGISFPKSAKNFDYKRGLIACLRTKNLQKEVEWKDLWFIDRLYLRRDEQIIKKGDILISISNSLELLGKVALVKKIPYEATLGTFIVNLRVPALLNNKFVFFYLTSLGFKESVRKKASTTTNISNISVGKLKKINVPIPPLNEQNRIVEKIEELFSDLDKAVEDLKKTQEQLKIYRQAVLFKLCLPEKNWKKKAFSECFKSISPGNKKIKQKDYLPEGKIPIVDQGESLIGGYTDDENKVQDVTLPIVIFGDHTRRFKYINFKFAVGADGTKILKPYDFLYPKYAYYHCLILKYPNKGYSRHFQYVKKTFLFYPKSIDKQKAIVKEIESRLSVCDKLEETIKQSLQKIEFLRQSILKKAFEGKLVPQDPNDEPAEKLLERIKREKQKLKSNKKKRSKK